MKTNNLLSKVTALTVVVLAGFVISCGRDDEKLNGTDATNAISESLTDSYFEDADDMSLSQTDEANAAARTATDDRICDGKVTFSKPNKTIDIDFGTGCTDPRGNVRTGKIHIVYSGTPGTAGFKVVETFENYTINAVKLEGIRTIVRKNSDANPIIHDIDLADGKATWPDATYATRQASFERTVDTGTKIVKLDGNASGKNRDGKNYTMDITKSLVFKTSCVVSNKIYMAVEGTRTFINTDNNKTLIIDYGDGTCDRAVTITVGKVSFNYTINK